MKNAAGFLYKYKNCILFIVLLFIFAAAAYFFLPKEETKAVLDILENKTFDLRQRIISNKRISNKDIVIVSIDDLSYEYLTEEYGDWPVPRYVFADVLDYIQAQKPKYTIFDMLFVKPMKSIPGSDEKLAEAFKRHPDTYTAINFDNSSFDLRKPPVLDDKIKTDIIINSKTLDPYEFENCRMLAPVIAEAAQNIGFINTYKSDDGYVRKIPLIAVYPDYNPVDYTKKGMNYYLYMTVKLAVDYLNKYENAGIREIKVDKNNNLILGKRVIPMTENAEAVLNWYKLTDGRAFRYIPLRKVIKSIQAEKEGKTPSLEADVFKDKIVYIGASVFALSDIKTVPVSNYMPGVELHAVLLNNIIDNNIIKKAPVPYNILISLLLAAAASVLAFRIKAVFASAASLTLMSGLYLYLTVFVMYKYNLWFWIVIPMLAAFISYAVSFLIKYFITSRDFEHMYKLAATDGLTELYNHRFFQEQLRKQISISERKKSSFSLILLDIDFFKKFNDKYGHQAGDAVLKHVAKTLKSSVRAQDFVCRYGGEEMTIILTDTNRETAVKIAQKICSTIASRKYALSPDLEVNITVSLGVSSYPENCTSPVDLIEYADKCLYKAKENGRNQVGFLED